MSPKRTPPSAQKDNVRKIKETIEKRKLGKRLLAIAHRWNPEQEEQHLQDAIEEMAGDPGFNDDSLGPLALRANLIGLMLPKMQHAEQVKKIRQTRKKEK